MFDKSGESGPPCRPTYGVCPAFFCRLSETIDHNACSQEVPDQTKQSFVPHFACDSGEQHVVLNCIEKLGEIHIHAVAIASLNMLLHLLDCSVSRAFGSEAEARLGKSRIENRR